jgi:hypothetical protein
MSLNGSPASSTTRPEIAAPLASAISNPSAECPASSAMTAAGSQNECAP